MSFKITVVSALMGALLASSSILMAMKGDEQDDNVMPPHITYRTTGVNPEAKNKQSATSIKLSNQELQDDAYQLIVNHRTREDGTSPVVRIFNPSTRTYINLGALPSSPSGFHDTTFNLSSWAQAVHNDSSLGSEITTYVSFIKGESDVHSFTIRSGEKTLKEVIFGDQESESQLGVHVYAPETDQNANAWSVAKKDDVSFSQKVTASPIDTDQAIASAPPPSAPSTALEALEDDQDDPLAAVRRAAGPVEEYDSEGKLNLYYLDQSEDYVTMFSLNLLKIRDAGLAIKDFFPIGRLMCRRHLLFDDVTEQDLQELGEYLSNLLIMATVRDFRDYPYLLKYFFIGDSKTLKIYSE